MSNSHKHLLQTVKRRPVEYPARRFSGRGIVICAGGERYFTCAWVCIGMLQKLGCTLPIEVWHLGPEEMSPHMREILSARGVQCVDAYAVRRSYPVRILKGWELKPYAVIHSRFQEVLFLDADNVPVRDPTYLFDAPPYVETGAIFWPDYGRLEESRPIWDLCGVSYRDEPEFESGQLLIDKSRCWKALEITLHLNAYSDYYYTYIHGDKETFHMAWRCLEQPYAMPQQGIVSLDGTMCQHDFDGRVLFQHRNMRKWSLHANHRVPGFEHEEQCLGFIEELKQIWKAAPIDGSDLAQRLLSDEIIAQGHYLYVRVGFDARPMELLSTGRIGVGAAAMERQWQVIAADQGVGVNLLGDDGIICTLRKDGDGILRGRWLKHECMPVLLIPVRPARGEAERD